MGTEHPVLFAASPFATGRRKGYFKGLRRRESRVPDDQTLVSLYLNTLHGRATRDRRHVATRDALGLLALLGKQSAASRETTVGMGSACKPPYAFEAQLGLG